MTIQLVYEVFFSPERSSHGPGTLDTFLDIPTGFAV